MYLLLMLLAVIAPALSSAASPGSHVMELSDAAVFEAMGSKPGGVVRVGKVIKFLIDNRAFPNGKVYYINGNYCEGRDCPAKWVGLHYDFAVKKLPRFTYDKRTFEDNSYYKSNPKEKIFIAGRIQTFEVEKNGKTQVVYGVWFFERDEVKEEGVRYTLELIRNTFKIPGAQLAYIQYSQEQSVNTVKSWFQQKGIDIFSVDQVLAGMKVLPLNPGQAHGYLRVFPKDPDDLEANEIPVFDQLPLDLAVVAGTISTGFQDVGSHVNLKSKERGTPNVVVRDEKEIEALKRLDGQPVHLTVTETGYSIKPSTAALVQSEYEKKVNKPWVNVGSDLSGDPLNFEKMCRGKNPDVCLKLGYRYGGKASRLGFLAHEKVIGEGSEARKKFGYRLTPLGFGVPLRFYKEFVEYNSSINPAFKADLDRLIQAEHGRVSLTSLEKRALVGKVQENFLNAKFSPEMYTSLETYLAELKEQVAQFYPGEDLNKIKVRSSANAEDLENFNGAGLHDSYSATISKSSFDAANGSCSIVPDKDDESETKTDVKPKSLGCAIKAVYASLWNLRAIRERSYRRISHESAYMGLAIIPTYKFRKINKPEIAANSVLLTRVLNTSTVYGYQMSTQVENGLVTNPAPGTQAELATMAFQLRTHPAISILRYAKPKSDAPALEKPVLTLQQMRDVTFIARRIEESYCYASPKYFPGRKCTDVSNSARKPLSLDMELKFFTNGEVLFKQFRTFSGK